MKEPNTLPESKKCGLANLTEQTIIDHYSYQVEVPSVLIFHIKNNHNFFLKSPRKRDSTNGKNDLRTKFSNGL